MIFEGLISFVYQWKNEIGILFTTIAILIFLYIKVKFSYWKRHGFQHIKGSFPCGSITDFILLRNTIGEVMKDVYNKGSGLEYIGYYSFLTPSLLIRDPDLIRSVLVKDFDHFVSRGSYYNEKEDPLSAHLFVLNGTRWKTTRAKLNHSFSSGKIKQMYEIMKVCSIQLKEYLLEKLDENNGNVDFKELITRHSANVIANAAVGIEGHSLKGESSFLEITFKATQPTLTQIFRFVLPMLNKKLAELLRMRLTPKEVERCYLDLTKTIVEHRTKNNIQRNDFMQLLIELWDKDLSYDIRSSPDDESTLSLRDLAAQTFIFILAAYESTASVVCFALYEMAKNPEMQQKLIAEIDSIQSSEDVTYEQVLELKYLDMVLNETLRKYPPAGLLIRECQKDYTLPDGKILKKGTSISVSVFGLHRDPQYFPEPEKFNPERFNKDNPSQAIVPYTFIPFGEGPRFCIGKRFGTINSKVTLFTLFSKFRFELTEKSPNPVKLDPKLLIAHAQGGMYLKAIARK